MEMQPVYSIGLIFYRGSDIIDSNNNRPGHLPARHHDPFGWREH
jgi:hypothetical protein